MLTRPVVAIDGQNTISPMTVQIFGDCMGWVELIIKICEPRSSSDREEAVFVMLILRLASAFGTDRELPGKFRQLSR